MYRLSYLVYVDDGATLVPEGDHGCPPTETQSVTATKSSTLLSTRGKKSRGAYRIPSVCVMNSMCMCVHSHCQGCANVRNGTR